MREISFTKDQLKPLIQSLSSRVERWPQSKLIIVGDIGLDEYVFGDVRRISPEAPVPVVEVNKEDCRLGLAANVAQNVASLGGIPMLVGLIGKDTAGDELRRKLREGDVNPDYLIVDPSRPTTRKLRVMTGLHHIVRVDYERKKYLSPEVEMQLIERITALLPKADAVILEDYAKGALSETSLQAIIQSAHKSGKKVFLDPHRSTPAHFYRGVDVATPNRDEAIALSGLDYNELRERPGFILDVGARLRELSKIENVIVTRGSEGMTLIGPGQAVHMPTFAKQVFDVTGAGDTAISALAMAVSAGLSLQDACVISNVAAGVVVAKAGSVPCTHRELLEAMSKFQEMR
jgi:rfaE bifunctional protein kinase chain/domain